MNRHVVIVIRQTIRAEADRVVATHTRSNQAMFSRELSETNGKISRSWGNDAHRPHGGGDVLQLQGHLKNNTDRQMNMGSSVLTGILLYAHSSAASRNFEKGARSRTHFQKAGQPEYFWATHPFNAKHPFNIYLCITILQEAFISIITNFLFLKNTFKIQTIYYNRFLPFLLSREKKS